SIPCADLADRNKAGSSERCLPARNCRDVDFTAWLQPLVPQPLADFRFGVLPLSLAVIIGSDPFQHPADIRVIESALRGPIPVFRGELPLLCTPFAAPMGTA